MKKNSFLDFRKLREDYLSDVLFEKMEQTFKENPDIETMLNTSSDFFIDLMEKAIISHEDHKICRNCLTYGIYYILLGMEMSGAISLDFMNNKENTSPERKFDAGEEALKIWENYKKKKGRSD